jgi:hypothetical protein
LRLRRDPLEEGFTNTKSSAPAALFLRRHPSESKDCDCVAILRGGLHQHQIELGFADFFHVLPCLNASIRQGNT